ncbi:LytR/AlgR family response regulator transcription factor [Acetobacterium woodii]|uniref:Stage 0 sporulation protein A homolog n=1 Tax=Acetobacterium woodii (strain ATCC 29683 / DSM 1030 / JCM 2381 / KCTC 1655 / WB1) TaxID=931626 RepID=H6LKV7_ACEWD|nr:LytTR family DNA-binding domain-containing protein [Acetobacterium woodii]AFA50066.1 DNA-binding response regulator [Acetobacterium woodii DSM 1030]
MQIAICDDENEIRNMIARYVKIFLPNCFVTLYASGEALLADTQAFDLIFLDIHLDGINGMDIARQLRKNGSQAMIIFITALEEYIFQAFDVGAFHYLVKPIDKVKFFEVLKCAVAKWNEKSKIEQLMPEEKSITVKIGATTNKIYRKEIIYIESDNRKVILHKVDSTLEFYAKLADLAQSLGDDFARIHRSFLVNMKYILKYNATSVTLENGENIMMAKQKYGEFVKQYLKYSKRKIM